MRNALIVTVFACIGLSYEFIVPLRTTELVNETNSILENNKEQSEEEIETKNVKLIEQSNDLKSVQNRIEDKELYDQSNGEQSNISERSFIFINQKFRKPLFGPLYGPFYSPSEFLTDTHTHKKTLNNFLGGNPVVYINSRNSLSSVNVQAKNSHKPQQFTFPVIKQETIDIQPEILDKMYAYNGMSHTAVKKTGNTESSKYVELIKPSMLRSIDHVTPKEEKDTILWSNVDTFSHSKYQKEKKPDSYIPYESKQLSPVNSVIYEPDEFGYPSLFGLRSNKPEEIEVHSKINPRNDYNKNLIKPKKENSSNMLIKKILNDNDEVNKLLERYMADPITGSVSNEMFDPNIECEFNDCNLQSKAQIENKQSVRNYCKCGNHRLDIKKLNKSGTADTMKMYATTNEALPSSKSSEINDYGHLLGDETNIDNVVENFYNSFGALTSE